MSGDANNGPVVVAGRYRLLDALGQGGMGVVWRALDESLNREVAVKEVRAPRHLEEAEVQRLYTRLEREGWAAARISHRNVVTVYDVATHDGRPWIVMELVRGLSLADTLEADGPMTPVRAARIGAEVLAALRSAHEAGVVHRDVKPGNILIANDGRVVLTDFGIATIEGGSALTITGEVIGSPEFLAPERALGRNPGPPSDLWSLGVTLYAAVEGISPFRRDTALSTLRAVVDEELPRPVRAGALTGVLDGLLRKDPAQRTSAEEAERQLHLVAAGGQPRTATTRAVPPVAGYSPTAVSGQAPAGSPSFGPPPATTAASPSYGPSTTTTATTPGNRRAGLVFAAGLLVLALSGGGIAWALLSDDDGGQQTTGTTTQGSTGGDAGSTTGGETEEASETPSASPSTDETDDGNSPSPTKTVELTVKLSVHANTAQYTGACPPPDGEAPSFSGNIDVNKAPAKVQFRWITQSGENGTDWATAEFGSGEYSVAVEHTIAAYTEGGTNEDAVALEVKSPGATSQYVSFSTTCEQQTTESPSPGPS
ncbi:serine/threonine-protein kinase [Streptomyces sp. NPDC051940]|uniref:serine/threonine-protein kinase n=1 Tax=Streptomyces sp. NPDC051940 TaxID=3155675 RepID=UPI003446BC5F